MWTHLRHVGARTRPAVAVTVAVALAVVVAGCSASASQSAACGPDVREPLDSHSELHVIGDAPVPEYRTDPPTSGAHRPGRWPTGVLDHTIDKPVQVAMLEGGGVLLQYQGLTAAQRKELDTLAGGDVTTAPNPVVPAQHVIATAWAHKLSCTGVNLPALRVFIAAHKGKGA